MKQVGKIYSAVDAEELEAGDIVICANNLISLKKYELKGLSEPLRMIRGKEFANRFETSFGSVVWYNFAKLICPKKYAKVYKAWKNGAKVESRHIAQDDCCPRCGDSGLCFRNVSSDEFESCVRDCGDIPNKCYECDDDDSFGRINWSEWSLDDNPSWLEDEEFRIH